MKDQIAFYNHINKTNSSKQDMSEKHELKTLVPKPGYSKSIRVKTRVSYEKAERGSLPHKNDRINHSRDQQEK